MCLPVNDPISDFEVLGRGYYCTSQINKSGEIRTCAFYPQNKEDDIRKGFFTNKISMFRLCRDVKDNNNHQWTNTVKSARIFERPKNRIFKGFGVALAYFFRNHGFLFESAASDKNPFHMHLVIPDYNEPFRKVSSVSELLTEDLRSRLEDLRHQVSFISIERDTSVDFPTPCDFCNSKS